MSIHREKPGDEEWLKLNEMKMPLLLNFSQCQLLQGEYYSVIEHCTTVLEKDPGWYCCTLVEIDIILIEKEKISK